MITDDTWAKLLWAGLNVEPGDLPTTDGRTFPVELIRAITLTWLFAGQRSDEIARLRRSALRRAISGFTPRSRTRRRYLSWSYPRSARTTSGRRRGRPHLPRTGGTAWSSGISWVTSLRWPPVRVAASGIPVASVIRHPMRLSACF